MLYLDIFRPALILGLTLVGGTTFAVASDSQGGKNKESENVVLSSKSAGEWVNGLPLANGISAVMVWGVKSSMLAKAVAVGGLGKVTVQPKQSALRFEGVKELLILVAVDAGKGDHDPKPLCHKKSTFYLLTITFL